MSVEKKRQRRRVNRALWIGAGLQVVFIGANLAFALQGAVLNMVAAALITGFFVFTVRSIRRGEASGRELDKLEAELEDLERGRQR